jgi:hypothetical protein
VGDEKEEEEKMMMMKKKKEGEDACVCAVVSCPAAEAVVCGWYSNAWYCDFCRVVPCALGGPRSERSSCLGQ